MVGLWLGLSILRIPRAQENGVERLSSEVYKIQVEVQACEPFFFDPMREIPTTVVLLSLVIP